ncbi:hypothetical protein [Kineococcus sp. R86509]|uniref:hypothetical protein n=1 Tax=Kineococcus sp. R86509 TaxID=3093851 RepID=UPI0036D32D34
MAITTAQRDLAARAAAIARQSIEAARADTNLSEIGRQRLMAQAYLKARAQMEHLREEETETVRGRRAELERRLFGLDKPTAADVITVRDAQDRAEAARNADEASKLLARAERIGDQTLARAVAQVSADRGYWHTFDEWSRTRPDTHELIAELGDIDDLLDPTQRVGRDMAFALQVPDELKAYAHNPGQLQKIADGATLQTTQG